MPTSTASRPPASKRVRRPRTGDDLKWLLTTTAELAEWVEFDDADVASLADAVGGLVALHRHCVHARLGVRIASRRR